MKKFNFLTDGRDLKPVDFAHARREIERKNRTARILQAWDNQSHKAKRTNDGQCSSALSDARSKL